MRAFLQQPPDVKCTDCGEFFSPFSEGHTLCGPCWSGEEPDRRFMVRTDYYADAPDETCQDCREVFTPPFPRARYCWPCFFDRNPR